MASSAGTSTSAVISTLVANLILFGCFVGSFLILRLKFNRIYSPKSSFDLVPEEKKPEPLPKDPFRWVFILLTKPHSFIIQQAGLDGYFFLRYLLVLAFTFLFGICIYVVLLPINIVNGRGKTGFDLLSISNIENSKRYYAHSFMGWVFYGGFTYLIYRELFFFNSLRAAVLSSPRYAKKLSSRTVLFQCVPDELLDEKQFFKLFNGVKRVYVNRTNRLLDAKVRAREGYAMKLEKTENKLLKLATKSKMKSEKLHKKGKGEIIEGNNIDDYVPEKKRPKVKEGGLFSRTKVDTVDYCLTKIKELDIEVKRLQKRNKAVAKPKNAIFVEFEDQYTAQLAYQSVTHHNPFRMQATAIGLEPADIIWSNLRIFWWEKVVRRFFAFAAVIAIILLWAVPVAFVGVISNITYLISKLPWLGFINNMPKFLRGIITGLLPTVMLTILSSMLPIFIRAMARLAGAPSAQAIEEFTQKAYFGYLIINAFLITMISSSATSTVVEIINKPSEAMSILATQLPTSSNFYISYLSLQGLSISGGSLFQVVTLFLYYILGYILDGTVRKKWARFSGLGTMAWGTTFPVYTNLACITLAFAIISPIILVFASGAFLLCYVAICHNITYCFVEAPDARGSYYPRALFQSFTGIYIGQICMLGIFIVGKGWGPIVIQAIGLGTTIFCHIHMKEAFSHLVQVIPIDCMRPLDGVSSTSSFSGQTEYKTKVLDRKLRDYKKEKKLDKELEEDHVEQERVMQTIDLELNEEDHSANTFVPLLADRDHKSTESKNPIIRFIRPDVYLNFRHVKKLLPATYYVEPEVEDNKHAYDAPNVSAKLPKLWIPRDSMGLSKIEIEKISKVIEISDENAGFNKKGNIVYLGPPK